MAAENATKRLTVTPVSPTASTLPVLPYLPSAWLPVVEAETDISLAHFYGAIDQHILHPELDSSSILRADIIQDQSEEQIEDRDGELEGYRFKRRVRRKLLPRRIGLDEAMEQDCFVYESKDGEEGVAVLLPDLEGTPTKPLPFYHPQVGAIAFRCVEPGEGGSSGSLRIDYVLLPPPADQLPSPLPPNHRLYRTALALLQQVYKVAKGLETGYQKRVHHDLLANGNEVQDLYRVLKERYSADILPHSPRLTFRWLMREWKESTDPQKHFYEDVAIASWLIVLWRSMYPDGNGPPGGFVDIGCGNGLLVHILTQEGYKGYGIDLQTRKSWTLYPSSVDLRTQTIDPITLLTSSTPPFPPSSFLVGNHADELTPWLPLFAARTPDSSFLSIPCCHHTLSSKFTQMTYQISPEFLSSLPTEPFSSASTTETASHHPLLIPFYAPTSVESTSGRYAAYQVYLAHLTLMCGFVPEREALRMPSTRNFGMLGRKRTWEVEGVTMEVRSKLENAVDDKVRELVDEVRGVWSPRSSKDVSH